MIRLVAPPTVAEAEAVATGGEAGKGATTAERAEVAVPVDPAVGALALGEAEVTGATVATATTGVHKKELWLAV
jgi:hypothetical protein